MLVAANAALPRSQWRHESTCRLLSQEQTFVSTCFHQPACESCELERMSDETELFGEPKRDRVIICDPDQRWPEQFEGFRSSLASALGESALRIDHIGSTAVPGLPAKPVIDMQVSVRDVSDELSYRGAIESLGWPLRAREPEHRFFRPPSSEVRAVHVHVCSFASQWERRHLLFVAYLRGHPDDAAAYARLKRKLADRFARNRMRYVDGKDDFIAETLRRAEQWAEMSGWKP